MDLSQHYAQLTETERCNIESRHDFYESRVPSLVLDSRSTVGAKALDIGTGSGVAARMLKERGFEVTAVDPDLNEISVGHHLGEFKGVDLYPTTLQDLPVELNGTFDIAVYCHFLVPYLERSSFFERLAQLMKDSGEVYLFFVSGEYDYVYGGVVMFDLMRVSFKSVEVVNGDLVRLRSPIV